MVRKKVIGSILLLCVTAAIFAQDKEAPSPYMSGGSLSAFMNYITKQKDPASDPNAVVVSLLALENEPSTAAWLGSSFAVGITPALTEAIRRDLDAATWADLRCVPGEGAIVQECLRRAGRFKEISLPALWSISKPADGSKETPHAERSRRHASFVMRQILKGTGDQAKLLELLRTNGFADLADALKT